MLSDRPYRKALPLPVVFDQLKEHAGTQFDLGLVKVLLRSDILADYAEVMRVQRAEVVALEAEFDGDPQVTPLPVPSLMRRPQRLRRYR